MEINQNEIDDIKDEIIKLMSRLGIDYNYTLDDLTNKYKNVYYNIKGDDNRLKIMGTEIIPLDDGKKKQKSVQVYRLKREDRKGLSMKEFQYKYEDVMTLCFKIEQLKLYERIKELENKIVNIEQIAAQDKELIKIFENTKR